MHLQPEHFFERSRLASGADDGQSAVAREESCHRYVTVARRVYVPESADKRYVLMNKNRLRIYPHTPRAKTRKPNRTRRRDPPPTRSAPSRFLVQVRVAEEAGAAGGPEASGGPGGTGAPEDSVGTGALDGAADRAGHVSTYAATADRR